MHKLKTQGYTRLGVDFESINQTAYGFWLKHFDAYTNSVVRRIDEHAITKGKILTGWLPQSQYEYDETRLVLEAYDECDHSIMVQVDIFVPILKRL